MNSTLENDTAGLGRSSEAMALIIGGVAPGAGPGLEVMAADTLQGDAVVNPRGELLGKIRDLMVDVPRGRIAYAVMSSGGVMGFGDRLYAVPWSALMLDVDQRCFILDVDRERLQAAPGFDKDNSPSMADGSFVQSVYDYYGAEAYWS